MRSPVGRHFCSGFFTTITPNPDRAGSTDTQLCCCVQPPGSEGLLLGRSRSWFNALCHHCKVPNRFFFFLIYLFLFMAVLGLHFRARAFSSCGKQGPLFIAMRRPLTLAASLVAEHRLQTRRLSNCGSRASLLRGMWDLPRPGLEPVSPALAGRFSTTAPPGKPSS